MWHINLVTNSVEITKNCAEEIFQKTKHAWGPEFGKDSWPTDTFGGGGYLYFNDDHFEHMDYVRNPDLQDILLTHKVNGEIIFNSFDGDNSGEAWGYVFKDGTCTQVAGYADDMVLTPIDTSETY